MKEIAHLLFPHVTTTVQDLLKKFPPRKTPATRIAPSPTGHLHIGSVGMALCDRMLADALGGIAFIRIEDTDQAREVDGAVSSMLETFAKFGIVFDEGLVHSRGEHCEPVEVGKYAPYTQTQRKDIYHVFAKRLVERGNAYPCFCTKTATTERVAYRDENALCRVLSADNIKQNIEQGKPWVLRFKCTATDDERITWQDLTKGQMSLPAKVNDAVILKSNGLPPYNLAQVVDDLLMRTSHILRGEEWLVSTAEHIQIWRGLGMGDEPPYKYAHMPVVSIMQGDTKRKLSKRKDPEALATHFLTQGYPPVAVLEYMLTIYNTDFELWRIANPDKPYTDFEFRIEKVGTNSPLFDWDKLNDISRNYIAKLSCDEINKQVTQYFTENPPAKPIDLGRVFQVLAIDRGTPKPRKDLAKYSEILDFYGYIFDDQPPATKLTPAQRKVAKAYAEIYNPTDDRPTWFDKMKTFAAAQNAHVRDVSQTIRLALTGCENTPDLHAVARILGHETVKRRLAGL